MMLSIFHNSQRNVLDKQLNHSHDVSETFLILTDCTSVSCNIIVELLSNFFFFKINLIILE